MKRGVHEVSVDKSLEECVYEYIQLWQGMENGKGVGITCADLNNNIEHPEKPTGKYSERRFTEMMRGMSSLTESDEPWEGKVVFKIKEPSADNSPLDQTEQILQDVIKNMDNLNNQYHPAATRITINREEFTHIIEDLMAAEEFLRIGRQEC